MSSNLAIKTLWKGEWRGGGWRGGGGEENDNVQKSIYMYLHVVHVCTYMASHMEKGVHLLE